MNSEPVVCAGRAIRAKDLVKGFQVNAGPLDRVLRRRKPKISI